MQSGDPLETCQSPDVHQDAGPLDYGFHLDKKVCSACKDLAPALMLAQQSLQISQRGRWYAKEGNAIRSSFTLFLHHPNPFNPE